MRITVKRFVSDKDSTVSLVLVNDAFQCFGLEDEYREEKIIHETRIPAGTYEVALRTHGGFHNRYSKRFPGIHKGMLQIVNVPGFTDILIHIGNTDDDTSGCLLVGEQAVCPLFAEKSVLASARAYEIFYMKVIEAAQEKTLNITFIDKDKASA